MRKSRGPLGSTSSEILNKCSYSLVFKDVSIYRLVGKKEDFINNMGSQTSP